MIVKCYQEFNLFNITSLIHTRDWVLYAWTSILTSRVHTAEDCQESQQFAFRIGRAPVNPHLDCGFLFLSTQEYQLPGGEISQHRPFTLGGIFRGVVVRQWNLVFIYIGDGLWPRFDLTNLEEAALAFTL